MCVWGGESVRTCARKSNAWLLNSSAKNGNKISPSEDIGCSRFHQNKRISARVLFLIPLFCLIFVKVRIARKKNYQVRLLRSFGQGWWSSRLLQTLLLRVRSPCLWDKIIRDLWYFTIASTTTIASISLTFTSTTSLSLLFYVYVNVNVYVHFYFYVYFYFTLHLWLYLYFYFYFYFYVYFYFAYPSISTFTYYYTYS